MVATFIDISERKRSEMALQDLSKQMANQLHKFNTVMTAVPDFIYHFDLEGRFTYVNQSLLNLWQKTSEQVIGKNFYELDYPPELAEKLHRQIQEVIEKRRPLKDETPYTSVLGSRMYEYILFPLLAENGAVEAVAGTTRDITDRKETEEALRKSEERYRALFELVPVAVYSTDAKGVIQQYNRRAVELWGRAPREGEEFCGSFKILWPDGTHMPHEECPMARVLRDEELGPADLEITVEQEDGTRKNVIVSPRLRRNERGEITGARNRLFDITERKQSEEALRESEARFRAMFEQANVGIMQMDSTGRFLSVNPGFCSITGYPEDELRKMASFRLYRLRRLGEGERVAAATRGGRYPANTRWKTLPAQR